MVWVQIKRAVAVRAREAFNAQTQQWVEAAISNGVQKLGPGSLWMFVVQCFDWNKTWRQAVPGLKSRLGNGMIIGTAQK